MQTHQPDDKGNPVNWLIVIPVSIWKETEKSSDFSGLPSAFCGGIFCSGIQGDES